MRGEGAQCRIEALFSALLKSTIALRSGKHASFQIKALGAETLAAIELEI